MKNQSTSKRSAVGNSTAQTTKATRKPWGTAATANPNATRDHPTSGAAFIDADEADETVYSGAE